MAMTKLEKEMLESRHKNYTVEEQEIAAKHISSDVLVKEISRRFTLLADVTAEAKKLNGLIEENK